MIETHAGGEVSARVVTLPDIAHLQHVGGFDRGYLHVDPTEAPPVSSIGGAVPRIPIGGIRPSAVGDALLLQETIHRCSNDLQLVVSLLGLQGRRASNPEVAQALSDASERVAVLARARRVMHGEKPQSLSSALRQVCEALHAQAEPRSILVTFEDGEGLDAVSPTAVTTLALVVNELVTNAIKHAFEEGQAGSIRVSTSGNDGQVTVIVDDDGLPFPKPGRSDSGMGMSLAKRLMASVDGSFLPPEARSKVFTLRAPVRS